MAAEKLVVLFVALVALGVGPADSGFVITTPRRWTLNSDSQVCVVLTQGTLTSEDSLNYSLVEVWQGEVLQPETSLALPAGQSSVCVDVVVPPTSDHLVRLDLTGTLSSEPVKQSVNLTFVKETEKVFIQTDKYLYKPGQTVQLRILTVSGPDLTVSTENYEEVYINNPSRTRIAQWRNVSNHDGLVHLSFDLFDEIDEGTYTVGVKLMDKNAEEKIFRVEDYVLPRYEVTIDAPKNILGSDKSVTVTLCAKYTFGEPVNGVAELYLAAGQWRIYANLTETKNISGCENFTFPTNKLHFDDNNCHIRVSNLKANAKVTEDGTGVELFGENEFIQVYRRAIQFDDETPATTKKSYLPYSVKLATKFPDKKPAKQEKMEVCTFYIEEDICKNFTTDNQGYLHFVMPSEANSRIEVKAVNYPRIEKNWNDVMEESIFYKYYYNTDRYIDVTNSSLTIFLDNELQCNTGQDINFNLPIIYVVKDQPSADLFVQVISRGQVVSTKKVAVNFVETPLPFKTEQQFLPLESVPEGVVRGVVEIPMSLTAHVSPKVKILVWYSTPEGIAVADSKEVEVTKCLPHNVQFGFSAAKAEPGTETNLILSGSKDSLCSIGVVDKSVELLSAENNKLDIQAILQLAYNSEVATWDANQLNLEYCLHKYKSNETGSGSGVSPIITTDSALQDVTFRRHSNVEAIHMFDKAGYYVISDLIMEKLFCDDLIISDLKQKFNEEQPHILDRVGERPAPQAFAAAAPSQPLSGGFGQPVSQDVAVEADFVSPQTKEGGTDETQERSYLPETWLWLLKPLSSSGELSEPVTLPDTITEWVGRAVCVHPSEGVGISDASSIVTFTPFFVDLTLPSSVNRGETLPVKISIFNYLDEDLPVKVFVEPSENFQFAEGETGVRELCIPAKLKSVETIKITMAKIGDVNITTEATTQPLSSGSCGTGAAPVKKDRFVRSLPVEPEGYAREKTWTKYICSQDAPAEGPVDTWNLEAPAGIVEGSERAWITAIGDLMGPTVENIGNLVRFPQGCGEQNMVNFAPNIYILQYLEASNQMTEHIRAKLTKFLNSGYQRQLMFKRTDGSYSTFGNIDKEGSTWLTAFVLKSLAQAKPYTLIDEASLKGSADWLKSLQNPDGCFDPKGRVINKMLQGGIQGSGGSKELLTAYVLAALLEEGTFPESLTASAVKCIELSSSVHPYSLALKAYTLALAKAPTAKTVIDQLMGQALRNSSDLRWSLPDRRGESTSLHVETAAYALLALVTFDPEAYADDTRKIVRWISGLRNGQGGFISTQDTVVALQALAAFEKVQPRESLDMVVTATSPEFTHSFTVNEGNKFLQQRVDLATLPATVELGIGGQGCSLAQGVLRYNVLADSQSDAFTLRTTTSEVPEKDCKTNRITVCTSYTLPDKASNMAILEVKLVSGYIPLKQDLKDVIGDGSLAFKRYEVDGRKVTFYLEEVTADMLCASFRVYQDVLIENAKPGTVSIYDYYQPEFISTEKFTLTTPTCPAVV